MDDAWYRNGQRSNGIHIPAVCWEAGSPSKESSEKAECKLEFEVAAVRAVGADKLRVTGIGTRGGSSDTARKLRVSVTFCKQKSIYQPML
jgi:hypothetical protein